MAELVEVLAASHAPLIARDWPKLPPHHQTRLTAAYQALGARLNRAKPDVLVIVSPDHWINFFIDNMPTVCIGVGFKHRILRRTPFHHRLVRRPLVSRLRT